MKSVLMIIKLSISLIKIMAIYQSPKLLRVVNLFGEWRGLFMAFFNQKNYQTKRTKSISNVNAKRAIVLSHELSLAVTVISLKSLWKRVSLFHNKAQSEFHFQFVWLWIVPEIIKSGGLFLFCLKHSLFQKNCNAVISFLENDWVSRILSKSAEPDRKHKWFHCC